MNANENEVVNAFMVYFFLCQYLMNKYNSNNGPESRNSNVHHPITKNNGSRRHRRSCKSSSCCLMKISVILPSRSLFDSNDWFLEHTIVNG
jgi:hypothetical protein